MIPKKGSGVEILTECFKVFHIRPLNLTVKKFKYLNKRFYPIKVIGFYATFFFFHLMFFIYGKNL